MKNSVDWRMVVNLIFLLALLVTARSQWFARADHQMLKRRRDRKMRLAGFALLLTAAAGRAVLERFLDPSVAVFLWLGVIGVAMIVNWPTRPTHGARPSCEHKLAGDHDGLRYAGGPLDGIATPTTALESARSEAALGRIDLSDGHYELNREMRRYDWIDSK